MNETVSGLIPHSSLCGHGTEHWGGQGVEEKRQVGFRGKRGLIVRRC